MLPISQKIGNMILDFGMPDGILLLALLNSLR